MVSRQPFTAPGQWLRVLLTAAIYALAGIGSTLLIRSFEHVSPVWPAAGLALAALLVWGQGCWPGVWLGAFLVGLFTNNDSGSAPIIAAAIATGASLQALLGAWLARRFLDGLAAQALAQDWNLLRFLFLAGPLACTVSATMAMAAFVGLGLRSNGEVLVQGLIWWAGDTLGVLLFTPLALLVWPGPRSRWQRETGSYPVALPLLITAALLATGNVGLARQEENRARLAAEHLMREVSDQTFLSLPQLIPPLQGVSHFIAASNEVTRQEFAVYTELIAQHPALLAVDWAPRVTRAERGAFEARLQREGFAPRGIFQFDVQNRPYPSALHDQYFPVLYSEPLARNAPIVGLDHGFEVPRRQAMATADMDNTATVAAVVRLLRSSRQSLLVYVPVPGKPGRALQGYVVGVFDVEKLLAPLATQAGERNIAYRLSDVTPGQEPHVFLDTLPPQARPALVQQVEFGSRVWRLELESTTPGWKLGASTEARLFLALSVLASFLAAFSALGSAGRHALTGAEVAKRTAELEQELAARREAEDQRDRFFNLSLDLLCIAANDGYFHRLNPAFTQTLGWSEAELLATPFLELIHPEDREGTLDALGTLSHGNAVLHFENRYRCKDGSWRWLEWKALPQPDGLIFATARDTSARHEFNQHLQELNEQLEQRMAERETALDALGAKKEELRAILDHLLEGVITINAQGIVHNANPAVEKIFGYRSDEIIGRNVALIMPEPHASRHDGYLQHYQEGGVQHVIGFTREVTGRHKDGHEIPLELNVTEYVVRGEKMFAGTLRDIRERRAMIADLRQAREAAEQASRAKSAFLAAMSHEIRTPMNGVIGLVDVLTKSRLTEHQADLVRTIRDSSSILLGIIDDILDFSKIEAGRLELELTPLCLAEMVEGLCSSLLPVAARRKVELSEFVAPEIPDWVIADEVRLRQVLYNLIGNAIKFSSGRPEVQGKVTVRVGIAQPDPFKVAISIADNGIGIAGDKLEELFSPFTQAETSTTRRYGGTGLGLAICRRLVDLMQGEIQVESTPGAGTTFLVTLPLTVAADQPKRRLPEVDGINCILVTAPEYSVADLQAYLRHGKARVWLAPDQRQALAIAAGLEGPVVLVTPDGPHPTPGLDLRHIQMTRGQRRRPRGKQDFITVDSNALRRETLLRAVAIAAGRASPEVFYDNDNDAGTAPPKAPPSVAEARAQGRLILVAEDDEINQKVILQQLGLLGYAAEIANNGAEALRLWHQGNYALLLTDLHMPEMDGYLLTETIRREEGGQGHMPILALTANALQGEARRAQAAGMDEYLTKPIRLELLRVTLEKWLPTDKAPAPVQADGAPAALLDVSVLQSMVGDDPNVLQEFLSDYQKAAGKLAAQLQAACQESPSRGAAAIAHKLKSASRAVGALALGQLCADLENAARAEDKDALARGLERFQSLFAELDAKISERLGKQ